jgi:4-hydroxy-3-polyprenylbenzoate decarboxylase
LTDYKAGKLIVAITGASGAPYAIRLLQVLGELKIGVELISSHMGRDLLRRESGIPVKGKLKDHLADIGIDVSRLIAYTEDQLSAPPASGSHLARGMVICPCSVKTLSAVASGASRSLVERAAEVNFKEGRTVILVVRETPCSLMQIENMRAVTLAGGVILPANPGFYNKPKTIDDLIDFVVARVLDRLGIEHSVGVRWGDRSK